MNLEVIRGLIARLPADGGWKLPKGYRNEIIRRRDTDQCPLAFLAGPGISNIQFSTMCAKLAVRIEDVGALIGAADFTYPEGSYGATIRQELLKQIGLEGI